MLSHQEVCETEIERNGRIYLPWVSIKLQVRLSIYHMVCQYISRDLYHMTPSCRLHCGEFVRLQHYLEAISPQRTVEINLH